MIVTITLNPCIDKALNVDRVIPDAKLAGEHVRDYPGGGGINVARAITRLGGDALALWSCGGEAGRRLGALLDAEDVPHSPIVIAGDVRENLIITETSTGAQYRFGLPGPTLDESERGRWLERLRDLPASSHYVVFSGSLPGDTPVRWCEAIFGALPRAARVLVDTKKQALRQALSIGVYLIKPNVRELEEVAGRELRGDDEIEAAAREIIGQGGAEVVLVSLGRGGALLVTADEAQRLASPSVPVRSKVGAGDSMLGGVVFALDRGRSIEEAARLGVAAGAAAVMREGTELCQREDVERLVLSVRGVER